LNIEVHYISPAVADNE